MKGFNLGMGVFQGIVAVVGFTHGEFFFSAVAAGVSAWCLHDFWCDE